MFLKVSGKMPPGKKSPRKKPPSKLPPGNMPPGKLSPGKIPPRKIALRKKASRKIVLLDFCLTFSRGYLFGKMDYWPVDPSDARNWYQNKWTLVIQLIKPLNNWLEQPFTKAACMFDYVIIGFGFLSLVFAWNSIDNGFWEV